MWTSWTSCTGATARGDAGSELAFLLAESYRLLGEGTPTWEAYRRAPAAKHYHQAYPHGLLEHSLSVAQAVSAISAPLVALGLKRM